MCLFGFYLLLGCDLFVLVLSFGNMLGPADFIFQRFEVCEMNGLNSEFRFDIIKKKHNRSVDLMDIFIDTPYPIDSSVVLELNGSIHKEGGYKPGALYMKEPACKTLSLLMGEIFTMILNAAGKEDCPLPAGSHEVNDYYFDNERFNVKQLYGDYKMESFIYKDSILQACFVAFYDLIPKGERDRY